MAAGTVVVSIFLVSASLLLIQVQSQSNTTTTAPDTTTTATTTTTTATTTSGCLSFIASINVTCPTTTGISFTYPDVDHCSRFWECYDGCATNLLCQLDYLYDEDHGWCNFPQEVVCWDRPCDGRPCAPTPAPTVEPPSFTCPDPNGFFGDPTNCIKYYQCVNSRPTRNTCPMGAGNVQEYYSPENEWCDYPDRVDCGERPVCDANDQNCNQMTTPMPTICNGIQCDGGSSIVAQGPCERCFCECKPGYVTAAEVCCQPGLAFNPGTGQCGAAGGNPGCGK